MCVIYLRLIFLVQGRGPSLLFFPNGYSVVPSLFVENAFSCSFKLSECICQNQWYVCGSISRLLFGSVGSYKHHSVGMTVPL